MGNKDFDKIIDEMPRFSSDQEKLEWAEGLYQMLCAEEGDADPIAPDKIYN